MFLCEKVTYTSIDKIVGIQDAVENTITGVKGIGGLQTRGKLIILEHLVKYIQL